MEEDHPEFVQRMQEFMPRYGTNHGCGIVWDRPDGLRMRCMGPVACYDCLRDNSDAMMAKTIVDAQFAKRAARLMQYLLSEEEMAAIRKEREDYRRMPKPDDLTRMVQHLACTIIPTVLRKWGEDKPIPEARRRIHGCIHVESTDDLRNPVYCDYCPVQEICPQPKDYSK